MSSPDANDVCTYCSHPRYLHVITSCRYSTDEPSSGERPGGIYVCGCDRFVEPSSPDASGDMHCTCHRDANAWRTCPHEPHRTDPVNLARATDASGDVRGVPVYTSGGAIGYGDPPGRGATGDDHMRNVMHSLSDEAQAARREAVAEVLRDLWGGHDGTEDVLRVLGLST